MSRILYPVLGPWVQGICGERSGWKINKVVRGLDHVAHKKMLRELGFYPAKKNTKGNLIVYNYVKDSLKNYGPKLYVLSSSKQSNKRQWLEFVTWELQVEHEKIK